MDLGVSGRPVLVTGAGTGIGAAIARAYAAEGARVALTYHTGRERAEKLAEELAAISGSEMLVLRYSLDDPASIEAAIAELGRWDGPDVLIANAVRWGLRRAPGGRVWEVPPQEWEPVIGDNLAPTIRTVQLAKDWWPMRTSRIGTSLALVLVTAIATDSVEQFGAQAFAVEGHPLKDGLRCTAKAHDLGKYDVDCTGLTKDGQRAVLTERNVSDQEAGRDGEFVGMVGDQVVFRRRLAPWYRGSLRQS